MMASLVALVLTSSELGVAREADFKLGNGGGGYEIVAVLDFWNLVSQLN